jgi:hypothetical protein
MVVRDVSFAADPCLRAAFEAMRLRNRRQKNTDGQWFLGPRFPAALRTPAPTNAALSRIIRRAFARSPVYISICIWTRGIYAVQPGTSVSKDDIASETSNARLKRLLRWLSRLNQRKS